MRLPARLGWIALVVAAAGCQTPGEIGRRSQPRLKRRPNVPGVLVMMPASPLPETVLAGIIEEIGADYDVIPRYVDEKTSVQEMAHHIDEVQPLAIVLMNNPTVRLYRRYQQLHRGRGGFLPTVVVLSSFLKETTVGLINTTGIVYEIPVVTSLVNLRLLLKQPLRTVGVVHRPLFRRFVAEQRRLASVERFELVGEEVATGDPEAIREAISNLTNKKVDALWVLNDNGLLTRDAIVDAWLPSLKRSRTPVIVNVSSLLSSEFEFGTFAVLPDHRALGVQAANLLLEMAGENWRLAARQPEYPLSVETVLAVDLARRNVELNEEQLATVDRIVK